MRDCPNCTARDPCTTTFIACYRAPATCPNAAAPRIHAATNGTSSGNHNHARTTVGGRGIKCYIGVATNLHISDAEIAQRFAHSQTQFQPARSSEANLRRDDVFAANVRLGASFIDGFADSSGRVGDTYAERIGGSRDSLTQHLIASVENHGFGFCTTAVNTYDRASRHRSASCQKIRRSALGGDHSRAGPVRVSRGQDSRLS
jgi:hypothetical protein